MADTNTFENLALPLLDALYRTACVLTGNEHDARDLVQATYLRALEHANTYRVGTNCKAWMMSIMRNMWIDVLRRRKVAGPILALEDELLPARPDAPAADSLPALLERFTDAEVIRALNELPEPQRIALFLSDVEDLDQTEVAEVLGVAVGTVKSRVSRARGVLREKLEAHARDMGFLGRRPCRT